MSDRPSLVRVEVLDGVELMHRMTLDELRSAWAEVMLLRARLGDGAPRADGVATLHRLRALENAVDLAREHLAGRVSRVELAEALDRCRRVL